MIDNSLFDECIARYMRSREEWALRCVESYFPGMKPEEAAKMFTLNDWPDREDLILRGVVVGSFAKPSWGRRK